GGRAVLPVHLGALGFEGGGEAEGAAGGVGFEAAQVDAETLGAGGGQRGGGEDVGGLGGAGAEDGEVAAGRAVEGEFGGPGGDVDRLPEQRGLGRGRPLGEAGGRK